MTTTDQHAGLRLIAYRGAEIADAIEPLGALRVTVFRDWPYLYEGSPAEERGYLSVYARAPGSIAVCAFDGDAMVGATTAIPMTQGDPEFAKPFVEAGIDISRVFYLAESVLLPAYRGRGLGHVFFDRRESHARDLGGLTQATFCAVQRPDDHPRKPVGYVPLDGFWTKRGYVKRPDLMTEYSWLDVGETAETPKPMMYWVRDL